MEKLYAALFFLAAVFVFLHAVRVGHPKMNFFALGMVFFIVVFLIQQVKAI